MIKIRMSTTEDKSYTWKHVFWTTNLTGIDMRLHMMDRYQRLLRFEQHTDRRNEIVGVLSKVSTYWLGFWIPESMLIMWTLTTEVATRVFDMRLSHPMIGVARPMREEVST